MDQYVGSILRIIEATGPAGAILAAIIVGLALASIIYARSAGLFDGARTEHQKTEFQERLIAEVDKLSAREADLRREAERIEAENDRLKDQMRELQTSVVLMRNQLRRQIDLLRAVREGRLDPTAIDAADTMDVAP